MAPPSPFFWIQTGLSPQAYSRDQIIAGPENFQEFTSDFFSDFMVG